jgi:hypothetical protein
MVVVAGQAAGAAVGFANSQNPNEVDAVVINSWDS